MTAEFATERKSSGKSDYAGGWITDGAESPLPPFLRVCFVVVASSCIAYLILFMFGEVGQAGPGTLVAQLNQATTTTQTFTYAVGLLAAAFFVGVSIFAANSPND